MIRATIPGHACARLVRLIRERIEACDLRLSGATVLTEAAIGAYSVTPVIAAIAGAKLVYALARATRYGTVEDITFETEQLAQRAGVEDRIVVLTEKSGRVVSEADIVTNSGHVRPIDRGLVASLKPTAVVPLMYEAWEFRKGDVDLEACRERGIAVAGTNERHPAVDVFSYLGIMAVKLLLDAGIAVYGSRVLLLCDNPFATYIERGLKGCGAVVVTAAALEQTTTADIAYDAIVVALRPTGNPRLTIAHAEIIAKMGGAILIAQYWGDIDRPAFTALGIGMWPPQEPGPGHMGILPSAIGPEAIVRLQTGGLKVGELLSRARFSGKTADEAVRAAMNAGFGDSLSGY